MIFATGFNLANSRENDNEFNISIETLLDTEQFSGDMDVDLAFFDNHQGINQTVTLDDKIYPDMNSVINEEKEIIHERNQNNLENENIDSLPQNRYNNENNENIYDGEFIGDIKEALRHLAVLGDVSQYEEYLISNNLNDMIVQEHPSDCNATSIYNNILVERQLESHSKISCDLPSRSSEINSNGKNEITENSYVVSSKTLDDQEKSIVASNLQSYHYIDHKDSTLIRWIILDNIQLTEIPDLTLYKDSLKSLSMKNNHISSITVNILKLKSLKKLDLSHNVINKIECELECMELELLDLSYNHLTYLSCEPIFSMTTLKYLSLQNNKIDFIGKVNSKGLLRLNISNNPISRIGKSFYELPNITELFMSNFKVTTNVYFNKILPKLKVLDLSYNRSIFNLYNIEILITLEEINLSNCELESFEISSEMISLKKLILCNNNIEHIPIDFKKLRGNIEILDLRKNPLDIITTKPYIGALGLLEHFYGKVLLDESIMQDIQRLSLYQIYTQKYKKDSVYFQKQQKNTVDDEFYINIRSEIVESDSNELKNEVEKVIKLVEEIRDSGFMDFEKIMKKIMKILECENSKNIIIDRILIHLNSKFSSRFYEFLDAIIFNYKLETFKLALNYVYNSNEHLNYWMYHLRYILSFTGIEKIEVNPQIHNDKNIILSSFINIANSGKLIRIIKLELEEDKEMIKILPMLLSSMKKNFIKILTNGTLEQMETIKEKAIKHILKKYQIIDQYQ